MPADADARERWLRFELVNFQESTGIPNGWDAELLRKGAPKDLLGAYQVANKLTLLEVPGYGQLVCFGTCGRECSFCLDPRTKAVVFGVIGMPGEVPGLVNSSLSQFIASVRAVLDRFPFDSGESGGSSESDKNQHTSKWAHEDKRAAEWDHAADDLIETLRRIDPAAVADPDGFWMTFVADVQMGDFSTKMVLGEPDE